MHDIWARAEELAWMDHDAYRQAVRMARCDIRYTPCDILLMWRRARRFRRVALRIGARLNSRA